MTDTPRQHLTHRLAALEADLAGVALAGPAAARQRAAQRTRRQVTGGVLAGVAAVAIGFFGVFQEELVSAPPQPAHTPTPNVTAPPSEALLTLGDLPGAGDIAWSETDQPGEPFDCAPTPAAGSAEVHYISPDFGRFDHFVESSTDAERRFADLRSEVESCAATMEATGQDEPHRLIESWSVDGLGDEAWMAAYFAPLATPVDFIETNLVLVRMVRSGPYVSVVVNGGPGNEFNEAMPVDDSVTAATRLCEAVGETCVGEPEPHRLYPENVGDLAGWLTADDVAQSLGLPEITEGARPQPTDGGWHYVGLPSDPVAAGARSVDQRTYINPRNTTGVVVDEIIARFPDEQTAREHYGELVAAADTFEQPGDVIVNTGSVEGPGYTGQTWRSENDEFGMVFVYGVVTNGDAVAAVVHGIGEDEGRDVTAAQMIQLMNQAGQRLGG
jgi:hypothetical protein